MPLHCRISSHTETFPAHGMLRLMDITFIFWQSGAVHMQAYCLTLKAVCTSFRTPSTDFCMSRWCLDNAANHPSEQQTQPSSLLGCTTGLHLTVFAATEGLTTGQHDRTLQPEVDCIISKQPRGMLNITKPEVGESPAPPWDKGALMKVGLNACE